MIYFRMTFLFVLAMVMQWWCSTFATVGGVAPQVLLLLTVSVAARQGALAAMCYGFAWGLFLDTLQAHLFGANALIFTLVGYAVGSVRKQVDVTGLAPQFVLVFVASLGYFVLFGLLGMIFLKHFIWPGWAVFALTPVYNGLLVPIAFWSRDRLVGV